MRTVPKGAKDDDILAIVREWIDLLAAGDSGQAHSLLNDDQVEKEWPPDRVEKVIAAYKPPAGVTPVAGAKAGAEPPQHVVSRWEPRERRPEVVGEVQFDLPIGGTWSELTATFWIREHGELSLELYDIHAF